GSQKGHGMKGYPPQQTPQQNNPEPKQCFARNHMTCRQYGLWTTIRERQGRLGYVFFNADDLSACFQSTCRDVLYDDCKQLLKSGFFQQVAPRRRKKD